MVYAGLGWICQGKNETKLKHFKKSKQASDSTWSWGGTTVLMGTTWPC